MYDWSKTLTITINGQLLLLMLCEQLANIGVVIDMCNTDGVSIIYKTELREQVLQVIKNWETVSKMEMESVIYKKVVRNNINNYLAVDDKGKFKEKGYFISKPLDDVFMELSRSHDFTIISIALREYFINNIPFETTIMNHTNIYDFCACFKVDKSYRVFWNGFRQQRLNRFYPSTKGAYLYKEKPSSKEPENMLKGFAVKIFNKYEDLRNFQIYQTEDGIVDLTEQSNLMQYYDIDYNYFLIKCREIQNEFESKQTLLF